MALKPIGKPTTKKERESLNKEIDKIKFVNVRFENRQGVGLWERRETKAEISLQVLGMNEDLNNLLVLQNFTIARKSGNILFTY